MVKGFRQIASLTAFSRVLGMLRDMAFAYFLGASGVMDAWVIGNANTTSAYLLNLLNSDSYKSEKLAQMTWLILKREEDEQSTTN